MRAVIQRVRWARVRVEDEIVGEIAGGLLVLLGVEAGDDRSHADYLVRKTVGLRVFEDAAGQMNRAITDVGGALLVVSQFTLLGDCRKGRRPSFISAMAPEPAAELCEYFVQGCRCQGVPVQTGRFRAMMQVELCNDGPVTLLLDSTKAF
ncbi:MAG: D-tyrosyl-tRNA(Tyr) deacylase [Deltaproteobacteria bacterium]|nr:D-tyrosyl-tRNA(Tyr) deacylase [Deltaproteobacteria bacterium]